MLEFCAKVKTNKKKMKKKKQSKKTVVVNKSPYWLQQIGIFFQYKKYGKNLPGRFLCEFYENKLT